MTNWDGRQDTPHTWQDEYELARENGWESWSFDEAGDMIDAEGDFDDVDEEESK